MMARREFSKSVYAEIVRRSISICSVDGCSTRVTGKGLCNLHYRRFRRHGDPLLGRPTLKGEPADFIRAAAVSDTDNCIIWPFSKAKSGYGTIYFEGRYRSTHRLVLELACGEPLDPSLVAAHLPGTCHNRSCVNPKHLRWATSLENARDRIIDGTHRQGEEIRCSRLTERQVLEIKKDNRSPADVARDFGVTPRNIRAIRAGVTWGWLDV